MTFQPSFSLSTTKTFILASRPLGEERREAWTQRVAAPGGQWALLRLVDLFFFCFFSRSPVGDFGVEWRGARFQQTGRGRVGAYCWPLEVLYVERSR